LASVSLNARAFVAVKHPERLPSVDAVIPPAVFDGGAAFIDFLCLPKQKSFLFPNFLLISTRSNATKTA